MDKLKNYLFNFKIFLPIERVASNMAYILFPKKLENLTKILIILFCINIKKIVCMFFIGGFIFIRRLLYLHKWYLISIIPKGSRDLNCKLVY